MSMIVFAERTTMTQKEFLIQHLTEDKNYKRILSENPRVELRTLQDWWDNGTDLRAKIRKSNALFSSRKGKPAFTAFEQAGKRAFFEWFQRQPRICAYCGIEEHKLEELFDAGVLSTKRGRGRSLELERKDAGSNLYTEENCLLACYFCNNHKSDIVSEEDHKRYFAPHIRKFLDDKYSQLQGHGN